MTDDTSEKTNTRITIALTDEQSEIFHREVPGNKSVFIRRLIANHFMARAIAWPEWKDGRRTRHEKQESE
jgi:hypothetical protein